MYNKHHKSRAYCKSNLWNVYWKFTRRQVSVPFFGLSALHSQYEQLYRLIFGYLWSPGQRLGSFFMPAKSPNVLTAPWALIVNLSCWPAALFLLDVLKEVVSFVPSMSRLILVSSGRVTLGQSNGNHTLQRLASTGWSMFVKQAHR